MENRLMRAGGKVAVFGLLGAALVVGIVAVNWSREGSVTAFQERIKDRVCQNITSSTTIDDIKPKDISFVSYSQKWVSGKRVEFVARIRVRRIPFYPTKLPIGNKVVPSGWVEVDITGKGDADTQTKRVGPFTLTRPGLICGEVKFVRGTPTLGPAEVARHWRTGTNLDPNRCFDIHMRQIQIERMHIDFPSLLVLFCARDVRQQGRWDEAAAMLTEMNIAGTPEMKPWAGWQREEQALIAKKSKGPNLAPGEPGHVDRYGRPIPTQPHPVVHRRR